ncbi:hypothetical protein [Rhodoblastus sp.]|jgi:hypothetical protein|uniref:hypothetical protein n=1 Tax=Rhodoblastus sp. TaxID=1962975 RepID=UPI002614E484|nr:hypothetical protein [Rhodoblastus sp.]
MIQAMFASMRPIFLLGLFCLVFWALPGVARAQSCNDDLAALGKSRNTEIEALNAISKAHGNKLDPVAACPHLRKMKEVETKMSEYLTKNKEWCNIPDDFYNNFKAAAERTGKIAEQACALAAKAKEMQQNGGGGLGNLPPPPKLPAGPL